MRRTKKLNSKNSKISKISKGKRANKKKNVRISKKKVGGGNRRKSMTPGRLSRKKYERRVPQTELFGSSAGKLGVKADGFFERRERERERIARKRAGDALIILRNIFEINKEIGTSSQETYNRKEESTTLWKSFILALREKVNVPNEQIALSIPILTQLRKYLLNQENEDLIGFISGAAQTGDIIDMDRMWYTQDGSSFSSYILKYLHNTQLHFSDNIIVYRQAPLQRLPTAFHPITKQLIFAP
jgi:hypothetical protein